MNPDIFPCLWFDGNGKQAADFYIKIFDGKNTADTPMVQNIEIFGQKLMLLDGGSAFQKNPSVSLMIICFSEEEILKYWELLSDGGTALMSLDEYPFAKKYGWIQDQFGMTWQVYFGNLPEDYSQRLIPNLMFINENNGKAKEAMEFYTNIFPNSEIEGVTKYGENNNAAEDPENIAHAEFTIDHYRLGCLDSSLDHQFNFSEGISLVKLTENQTETDYLWNSLIADGGNESRCGWLKDKYGVSWQIVPKKLLELGVFADDQVKGQKVFQAMMKMQKIIIADLEAAYNS